MLPWFCQGTELFLILSLIAKSNRLTREESTLYILLLDILSYLNLCGRLSPGSPLTPLNWTESPWYHLFLHNLFPKPWGFPASFPVHSLLWSLLREAFSASALPSLWLTAPILTGMWAPLGSFCFLRDSYHSSFKIFEMRNDSSKWHSIKINLDVVCKTDWIG